MTDKELCQAVEAWGRAHRAELVRDLIAIVNHRSISLPGQGGYAFGVDCKNCADAMTVLAESYGFSVENDDYYNISILETGKGRGELGILGHLDVVPEGEGWHYKPYDAIEKEGFVIGRGSSDNKGAVMMSLYVMRAMRELGVSLDHTLRLICGFNEEAGMQDVAHYLQGHQPPDYTIVCDGGWAMCIGEKGILNADLVLQAASGNLAALQAGTAHNSVPGSASAVLSGVEIEDVRRLAADRPAIQVQQDGPNVRITALGRAGHAAFPWDADNAVYHLTHFLDDAKLVTGQAGQAIHHLAAMFSDDYGTGLGIGFEDDLSGRTTCVASLLKLEDGCIRQHIDTRYAIRQPTEKLLEQLRASCAANEAELEALEYSGPRYTDPEAPVTKMLLDTVHEFLGSDYEPYTMGGGTHARKFPNALPYGPGGIKIENPFGSPHGIDEAVSIEALLMSMGTYAVALKRLDEML